MIEIIPKPAQKLPLWLNILFYFSIAALLGSISLYFILDHSLKGSLGSLQNLEETLAREKRPSEIALEAEVFTIQKKIKDSSRLFEQRSLASNFFDFLEGSCHPRIWFFQLSLSPKAAEAMVSGQAQSFSVLGQQLLILKEKPLIKKADLSHISIGEKGKVNFTLNLSLDPKVFQ